MMTLSSNVASHNYIAETKNNHTATAWEQRFFTLHQREQKSSKNLQKIAIKKMSACASGRQA
jgi:hypothetical protein